MNSGEMVEVWQSMSYESSIGFADPNSGLAFSDCGPILKRGEAVIFLMSTEPHFKPTEGSY